MLKIWHRKARKAGWVIYGIEMEDYAEMMMKSGRTLARLAATLPPLHYCAYWMEFGR